MSNSFIGQDPYLTLESIEPSVPALIVFLSIRNNFNRVFQTGMFVSAEGRLVYEMTNGYSYQLSDQHQWRVCH